MPESKEKVKCKHCEHLCQKYNLKEQCGWCMKYDCKKCQCIYDGYIWCDFKCYWDEFLHGDGFP